MAATIFSSIIKSEGYTEIIKAESAGLSPLELGWAGKPADPEVVKVCAEHGLDISGHLSRPLTREMMTNASVVIAMENWQKVSMQDAYSDFASKIFTLTELAHVKDKKDLNDISDKSKNEKDAFFRNVEGYLSSSWQTIIDKVRHQLAED